MRRLGGRRWWLATWLVLAGLLLATVPTTGDIGLTWDEPAYRYSQLVSIQWWERLASAPRSVGEVRGLVRAGYTALLLALRAARDQLPPSPGGSARPADLHALRALGEGHPGASAGVGLRVRPDDRAGVRLPGAAVRGVGRRRHGRRLAAHAPGLRRRPHRGDRHPGPAPLGGDGPGLLERAVRARRPALAGGGRRAVRPGLRREDGGRARRAARAGLDDRRPLAADLAADAPRGAGRLGRWPADEPGAAGAADAGVPGDPPPVEQVPPAGAGRTCSWTGPRPRCRGRSWPSLASPGSVAGCCDGSCPVTPSGESSARRWRPGRQSWRSDR